MSLRDKVFFRPVRRQPEVGDNALLAIPSLKPAALELRVMPAILRKAERRSARQFSQ
jgi:hypothetical protein